MAEVNEQEKQKAKQQAANLAVAANDAAVAVGSVGAIAAIALVATGVGGLAGVGVGAACAVGSFGAWWMGNRYQRLANDPPREDFDLVTISSATSPSLALSDDSALFNARKLAIAQFILADAIDCLVTSIERHDGAVIANNMEALVLQVDAIRQNALSGVAAIALITEAATFMNVALQESEFDWSQVQLEQIQSLYTQAIGTSRDDLGLDLLDIVNSIDGFAGDTIMSDLIPGEDPILMLSETPLPPTGVMSSDLLEALNEMSRQLELIVSE